MTLTVCYHFFMSWERAATPLHQWGADDVCSSKSYAGCTDMLARSLCAGVSTSSCVLALMTLVGHDASSSDYDWRLKGIVSPWSSYHRIPFASLVIPASAC